MFIKYILENIKKRFVNSKITFVNTYSFSILASINEKQDSLTTSHWSIGLAAGILLILGTYYFKEQNKITLNNIEKAVLDSNDCVEEKIVNSTNHLNNTIVDSTNYTSSTISENLSVQFINFKNIAFKRLLATDGLIVDNLKMSSENSEKLTELSQQNSKLSSQLIDLTKDQLITIIEELKRNHEKFSELRNLVESNSNILGNDLVNSLKEHLSSLSETATSITSKLNTGITSLGKTSDILSGNSTEINKIDIKNDALKNSARNYNEQMSNINSDNNINIQTENFSNFNSTATTGNSNFSFNSNVFPSWKSELLEEFQNLDEGLYLLTKSGGKNFTIEPLTLEYMHSIANFLAQNPSISGAAATVGALALYRAWISWKNLLNPIPPVSGTTSLINRLMSGETYLPLSSFQRKPENTIQNTALAVIATSATQSIVKYAVDKWL